MAKEPSMAAGNNVTVIGNVTREPELRVVASGQSTCKLGIAVNKRWQDKQSGDWKEETSFFDVVCWRELAENVAESVAKGTRVIVTGALEQRSWDDRETGAKRSAVEINADEIGPSLRWATANVAKTERSNGAGAARSDMTL